MNTARLVITIDKDEVRRACLAEQLKPTKKLFRTFENHPETEMSLTELTDLCDSNGLLVHSADLLVACCIKNKVVEPVDSFVSIKAYNKQGVEVIVNVDKNASAEAISIAIEKAMEL